MKFLDKAKINVKSGNGGHGCVSFLSEKNIEFAGPDGGNGGRGGDVVFEATSGMNTLTFFRYQQHFKAKHGEDGKGKNKAGRSAENLVIRVPIGTQIWDESCSYIIHDFKSDKETFIIARGGRGGVGNAAYKSSTNRAPRVSGPREPGEEMWVWLHLKLLANIGLIGLPNAGKSSLLSRLTKAAPKISDHPFTTLFPQLGAFSYKNVDLVIADLPGLIENAHKGKGLGHRFLGHAERCAALLHVIDASADNPIESYLTIRRELSEYHKCLFSKKEMVVLNKTDLIDSAQLAECIARLSDVNENIKIVSVSCLTELGMEKLRSSICDFYAA
ncbi:Obg family GTPase CgtA [Candidatus Hydrogenosomobacter endosymbioticus]|uniref:GTPase Obg n=1 Tax=Candidatus Hydrogenosomobacter endosymbioticus TaxID=2558174 RepID=A0ABM7V981_9PROT|nr:GTPase ObgE [Candidatus Hydrogenosomobacter endosymbioticus]BDB96349.1 GTPase Obg [Candidatus Hydrogenosomobacter endosymbioticus]